MCLAVCLPLEGLLRAAGVEAMAEKADFPGHPEVASHMWLRLPDGRILDPTADQFGLPPVYLGELPNQYMLWAGHL